jgi:hypothetical protein
MSSGLVIQTGDLHLSQIIPHPAPHQLPSDPTKFTGRGEHLRELNELAAEDSPSRIAVITGQPGVGKTALAVHWAHQVLDRFPDGQLHVDLRGYASGTPIDWEDVLEDFLTALGGPKIVIPTSADARKGLYQSLLSGRRLLVILDNALSAEQVRPLLPGEAGCFVLVTSRSGLPGLVARDGAERLRLDALPAGEAAELLGKVVGTARVPATTLQQLADLCGRLPLALRIVAEQAANSATHIDDLIADLTDERSRLDALALAEDDAQTAVRTVFSWSFRTLSPAAAEMFRFLGLWPGSDLGADAAAALAGISTSAARNALLQLANAHLIDADAGRFRTHDLLREYAKDMAEEELTLDDREDAAERLLCWYTATMNNAEAAANRNYPPLHIKPYVDASPLEFDDPDAATAWQATEHTNVLAVVRGAADASSHSWKLLLALLIQFANARHVQSVFEEVQTLYNDTIAAKESSIFSLEREVSANNTTIEAQGGSITALRQTVDILREMIAIKQETIDLQKDTISALQDRILRAEARQDRAPS